MVMAWLAVLPDAKLVLVERLVGTAHEAKKSYKTKLGGEVCFTVSDRRRDQFSPLHKSLDMRIKDETRMVTWLIEKKRLLGL
jgi:hypothetical protein